MCVQTSRRQTRRSQFYIISVSCKMSCQYACHLRRQATNANAALNTITHFKFLCFSLKCIFCLRRFSRFSAVLPIFTLLSFYTGGNPPPPTQSDINRAPFAHKRQSLGGLNQEKYHSSCTGHRGLE
jgi:hypothetical protein